MANMNSFDLKALGIEAADDYVADGVLLNDAVTKIAHREDLSADEVRRVTEFANQATYGQLWKVAGKQKTIEFPKADAGEILEKLNAEHLPVDRGIPFHKAARRQGSALDPESELRKTARKRVEAFRLEGTPESRLAHLKLAGDKVRERYDEELDGKQEQKRAIEEQCCNSMQQMMLERYYEAGGPGTKYGHEALVKSASEIVAAVKTMKPHHLKRAARLVLVAGKSIEPSFELETAALAGLIKSAAAVEGHLISGFLSTPDVPVMVINGEHKVFMMLEQLHEVDKAINLVTSGLIRADDDVKSVVMKIRETSGLPAGKYQASVG